MIRLERQSQLADLFFEKVWEHLTEKYSGKKGIVELFDIARGNDTVSKSEMKSQLKSLITATPEKLKEYITAPPPFVNGWDFIALYDQFTDHGLNDFYLPVMLIADKGFSVCPYCNRQYITNGKKRRIAELDHFYPKKILEGEELQGKKSYPYLAMSFYNLIPSCPSCNRAKSNDPIEISPYLIEDVDSYLQFGYEPVGGNYLNDKKQIKITITESNIGSNSYTNRLELEDHYQYHNDYVYEILK